MPNLRPIRRGQLISPFGVGSLVDFRNDESLMTAGLDAWPHAKRNCPDDWLVREERLESRLGVSQFRLPPDFREPGPGVELANQFIPFVRFPRWHYCPSRGVMEQLPLFGSRQYCQCRPGLDCYRWRRKPWLIPSRFIAVCLEGHIEDFPFMTWVHGSAGLDDSHRLRLLPGRSSAGLSGIRITCSCGEYRSMASAFNFDRARGGPLHRIKHDCSGNMPWLGESEGKPGDCGQHLRVVQRGASNVYFPVTVSSIYLPLWGEGMSRRVNELLDRQDIWGALTTGLDEGRYIQSFRTKFIASQYDVDPEELLEAAQRKLEGTEVTDAGQPHSEEGFRRQEYQALRSERGGESTELMVEARDLMEYGDGLASFVAKVCLVSKLRETRALKGFTRLLPVDEPLSTRVVPLSKDSSLRWLPAAVVYGEGIFIDLDYSTLRAWTNRPDVITRVSPLNDRHNRLRAERGLSESVITPKLVLMHTLAHILIGQLSYDCGYGTAALRERIYCETDDPDQPMQGILIYTASGDSEGTLGGLVRQGEPDRLNAIVRRALERAHWCSSDPVCIESSGQGTDNANLAACHGCTLLPETSCETGNRHLDRGLLVGTPEDPSIGFFDW